MSICPSSRKRHKLRVYYAVYLFYTVRFKKLENKNDRYDVTNFFWLFLCLCSLKVQQRNHLWCSILYWPVNPLTMLFCQTYSSLRMAWGSFHFSNKYVFFCFLCLKPFFGYGKNSDKSCRHIVEIWVLWGLFKEDIWERTMQTKRKVNTFSGGNSENSIKDSQHNNSLPVFM